MGKLDSDQPALGASVRALVGELHGRAVPSFVARDEREPSKLSVLEHLTLDDGERAAAMTCVELLANAPHPRLARVRGALERPGGIDVVSDFIDGELLEQLQIMLRDRGTAIPTMCALRLISDVLSGLNTLHGMASFASSGLGNLSPRSAIVGLDGRTRLIELVRDGAERGTEVVRYVAPEVLAGAPSSPRSDVYATGVMLAELLDSSPSDSTTPFLAVAARAASVNPEERFESAAAMLSALAGTFRDQAPSHADVARLMGSVAGEEIRARRVKLETAPTLEGPALRRVLAPPPSMPVTFATEQLPGSRRASSWPSGLDSGPISSMPISSPISSGSLSQGPPSSRRTDRPPPGFGSVPASGLALPLGAFFPSDGDEKAAAAVPAAAAPAAPAPAAAAPAAPAPAAAAARAPAAVPAAAVPAAAVPAAVAAPVRTADHDADADRTLPMARVAPPPQRPGAAPPSASTPPPVVRPSVVARTSPPARVAPPPNPARLPAATAAMPATPATPTPAPMPAAPAVERPSTQPLAAKPVPAPESRPTDSWRYASAKPVEPPRRALTLPVPDESIIVDERDDATVPLGAPPAQRLPEPPPASTSVPVPALLPITAAVSGPTSQPLLALAPPASVSHAAPPSGLRAMSDPPLVLAARGGTPRRTNALPIALGVVGVLALGAIGFLVFGHRDLKSGGSTIAAQLPLPPALVAASSGPTVGEQPRCAEGMIFIEGATFTMGSDAADAPLAAKPAHSVTLSSFCIDALEVSVAKFKACSDNGDCKRGLVTNDWAGITAAEHAALEPLCNLRDPVGLAEHPINCVDWERADLFCTARGARLPTDAEWEFAARGRDNRTYPWGADAPSPSLLNACGPECVEWSKKSGLEPATALFDTTDNWRGTAPGKTFPAGATPEGVMDLGGNVAEWVGDAFAPYAGVPQKDPVVSSGDGRVVRGGSFLNGKRAVSMSIYRAHEKATKRSSNLGFRCASPPVAIAGR